MTDRLPEILKMNKASPSVSRRRLLKRGGAAVGAAALLGGGQIAATAEDRLTMGPSGEEQAEVEETLRFDIAADGNTLRIRRGPGAEPDAPVSRGDSFIISGRIFPEGTVDTGLDDPNQDGSIGTWVCRGMFFHDLEDILDRGAVPHEVSAQEYLFDDFDGLSSTGMEGGVRTIRSVTGGYGQYAGVRGQCVEDPAGSNNTSFDLGGGVVLPAHNFRFEFQLMR